MLVLLASAALVAGCSFSWGDGGITDVMVAGRTPAELAPAAVEDEAAAAAPVEDEKDSKKRRLRRIAVLPVAYVDAEGGGQPCDLCPPSVQMKPTNQRAARLATGFLYEAIARHPRLLFPPPAAVEAAVASAPGSSLRVAAATLAAAGKAEVAAVAALVELRPRIGPDDGPERPAGVAMYMALVDARSGAVLWSDSFDRNEKRRGMLKRAYDKVIGDRPRRWSTAEGFAERAVDKLAEDLVDEID